MTTRLTFAHLTDIHLNDHGDSWGTMGSLAAHLLAEAVARFNAQDDLDFVLLTGDVLDDATPGELDQFTAIWRELKKPWHFVPGNHDGFIDPKLPQAFGPHEAIPHIDPRLAAPTPYAGRAHWSRTVAEGVQLIGLDTRLPDTWNGLIDAEQLAWLRGELVAHQDKLVIIAAHHPIHYLMARNAQPFWSNFIVDNREEVEALLDTFPNVRLVLAGHHHANHIRQQGGRLHVNTAALSGYPCAYRTLRLTAADGSQPSGRWHVAVETHKPNDEAICKRAYDMLLDSQTANWFNPANPAEWADLVAGRPTDRTFSAWLG